MFCYGTRNMYYTFKHGLPATMPMVMYISTMDWVRAVVIVPRLIRNPPSMTTGRWPKWLLNSVERGAGGKMVAITITFRNNTLNMCAQSHSSKSSKFIYFLFRTVLIHIFLVVLFLQTGHEDGIAGKFCFR